MLMMIMIKIKFHPLWNSAAPCSSQTGCLLALLHNVGGYNYQGINLGSHFIPPFPQMHFEFCTQKRHEVLGTKSESIELGKEP